MNWVELPDVKRVTNIRTICTAMEAHRNRNMLSEVHKLLRLFLTIPVTYSLSERRFFGDETTFYVFELHKVDLTTVSFCTCIKS